MAELHAVDGDAADTQSWDDFIAARRRARGKAATEVICGVEVMIPTDITLDFEDRLKQVEAADDAETLEELVGELFGDGALQAWREQGMTRDEFQIVFVWGISHANKKPITFSEAAQLAEEQEQGKVPAPNRAARRAASRPRAAATGTRSKRTSSASTASARKASGV